MPTNLPPEYFQAEHHYREANSPEEKIATLEALIGTIPKHKGTDKLRADYRRKLSQLKDAAQSKKGASKHESLFHIAKEGAGQIAVIGPTNTGKSALVAALTNATPEIAEFPFTTWRPLPGMMPFQDIQFQLVDTPPLDREHIEAELFDLIRRADFAFVVLDLHTDPLQQLQDVQTLLREHHIIPQHLQEQPADPPNLKSLPCLLILNKHDDAASAEEVAIVCELLEEEWPYIAVSATTGWNLDQLKLEVFNRSGIIRVYSKAPGKKADLTAPFILKHGSTIADFAGKVHKDFAAHLKSARVWGKEVYDGQHVQRDHILHDGDVVELHI